jgi:hypothetical protein
MTLQYLFDLCDTENSKIKVQTVLLQHQIHAFNIHYKAVHLNLALC